MTRKILIFVFILFYYIHLNCGKDSNSSKKNDLFPGENKTVLDEPKADSSVIVKYLSESDVCKTPYYILKGKTELPIIIIDGGIHGDEVAAYMACDTLLKYLKVDTGTVVIIPRLNILACNAVKRGLKNDFNRVFPGDKNSADYEYRLAYEFMKLVDSLKPEVVINHHEARNKFDREEYKVNPDKAFGQVLITCITPNEDLITKALNNLNEKIKKPEYLYNIQYYPLQQNHSLDNIVSKLKIKSYTVETYRGFNLVDRIKMHLLADQAFFEEIGIKYKFTEIILKN